MCGERQIQKTADRKGGVLRILKWGTIAAVCIILLLFFGIPLFLSSSGGTGFLLDKINSSVDGQVQMDDFSIGWFRGIKLTNLSYVDNAGDTSVTVERIQTQPKYISLLGGKVKLGRTVIEQPRIYVKVPAEQGGVDEAKTSSAKSDAPPPVFPVNQIDLELIDGAATVELIGDTPQTVSFENIASKVQIAEAGKPSSVDISMDVDDTSKISAKGTATPAKTGWTLKKGDFEVHISDLELASLKPLFALAGKEMDMAGQLEMDADIRIDEGAIRQLKADARISNFAQGTGTQRTVFGNPVTISALTSAADDAVKIEKLNVQSDFCAVDCTGTMENLNYEIKADLEQTQRFAEQLIDMRGLQLAGDLAAKGMVNLTQERIGVTGAGTAGQFTVKKDGSQTPMTDVQLDFDCAVDKTAEQFHLASANLIAAPGMVNLGNMALPLSKKGEKTISFDARAKLDLEKAWPFVQVFTELPKDIQVAGVLDSAIKATTTGSKVRLLTEQLKIDNLKIMLPDSEPFVQDQVTLDADVLMDIDKQTLDVRTLDLQSKDGESLIHVTKGLVEKKVSSAKTQLRGDFEAEYDWQTVSALASAYLPEKLSVKGKRKDAFSFESEYSTDASDQMFANLNANGTVGFDSADYFGLNFGPTELNMTIQKGILDFVIPPTTVNEGKFQFAGTVDLAEEPRVFHLKQLKQPMTILDKININDTVTKKLLMYTNPIFVDAVRTSGIASFSSQQMVIPLSGGDLMQLAIKGTFGIDSLKMQAGDFLGQLLSLVNAGDTAMLKVHPTDFILEKGYLSYQDMQVDVGDNPVNFKGEIGLDKSLVMDVKLPWTLSGDTVKTGQQTQNRVTLPIEGALTKPKIDTAKLIEKQGRQLIEQEVKRQLERLFE